MSPDCYRFTLLPVPDPMVSVFHTGGVNANLYAGSKLTLFCSIVLEPSLFSVLGDLNVTSVWSGPGSETLSGDSRIMVSPVSQPSMLLASFISTVIFNTLRISDDGTYTCKATVAPSGPIAGSVTNGVRSADRTTPTIEST